MYAEDVSCTGDIIISGSLINLEEVIAENITLTSNSGKIGFESLDFRLSLNINNSDGYITGELEGERREYTLNITDNNGTTVEGNGTKVININAPKNQINIEYDD